MSESVVAYEARIPRAARPDRCRSTSRRTTTTTTACAARSPGHRSCWPTGCAGRTSGLETQVTVRPTGWMRWQGSWTLFDKQLELRPGQRRPHAEAPPKETIRSTNSASASSINLPQPHGARRLSSPRRRAPHARGACLHRAGPAGGRGASPTTSSSRWSGRNLLHASHPEFGAAGPAARGDRAKSVRAGARELLMRPRVRTALVAAGGLARRVAAAAAPSPRASTTSRRHTCTTSPSSSSGPRRRFPSPDAPFAICVLGQDPFGPALDAIVQGERIQGRPLVVRRLKGWDDAELCHILFVSTSVREDFDTAARGSHLPTHADRRRGAAVSHGRRAHQLFPRRHAASVSRINRGERGAHGPANQLQADAGGPASIAARRRRRDSVAARPADSPQAHDGHHGDERRRARARKRDAARVGRRSASGPTCVTICRH